MNRWGQLGFLWMAFFLIQGTRQIYNAVLPQIQSSIGADSATMGLVVTVFTWVYGLCVPLAGLAGDRCDRKRVIAFGLITLAFGIFASGWVAAAGLLILFYGVINGAAQGFYLPSANSLLAQLFDEKSRSTAFAVHQTAQYIGIIALSGAAGWMAEASAAGWRTPFRVFGVLAAAWGVVMLFAMKKVERPADTRGAASPRLLDGVKVFLKTPSALLISIALGLETYTDMGFKTWAATFLQERGLSAAEAGFHCVFWFFLGAIAGVLIGSRVADRFAERCPAMRPVVVMAGLFLGAPLLFASVRAETLAVSCALFFAYGIARGFFDSNSFPALFEVVPARLRASVTSVALLLCAFISGFAPFTLGVIKDRFSLTAGMASLSAAFALGGVFILVAVTLFFKKDKRTLAESILSENKK